MNTRNNDLVVIIVAVVLTLIVIGGALALSYGLYEVVKMASCEKGE